MGTVYLYLKYTTSFAFWTSLVIGAQTLGAYILIICLGVTPKTTKVWPAPDHSTLSLRLLLLCECVLFWFCLVNRRVSPTLSFLWWSQEPTPSYSEWEFHFFFAGATLIPFGNKRRNKLGCNWSVIMYAVAPSTNIFDISYKQDPGLVSLLINGVF